MQKGSLYIFFVKSIFLGYAIPRIIRFLVVSIRYFSSNYYSIFRRKKRCGQMSVHPWRISQENSGKTRHEADFCLLNMYLGYTVWIQFWGCHSRFKCNIHWKMPKRMFPLSCSDQMQWKPDKMWRNVPKRLSGLSSWWNMCSDGLFL